jgi:hypothetical protein
MMANYQATVRRGQRYWVIDVEGVGATQARHLRELEPMTTDLVTLMTGDETPAITYNFVLPRPVQTRLARAEQLRAKSAEAQSRAAAEVREAARELHKQGISMRDIGRILGVSFQRAHQLVAS